MPQKFKSQSEKAYYNLRRSIQRFINDKGSAGLDVGGLGLDLDMYGTAKQMRERGAVRGNDFRSLNAELKKQYENVKNEVRAIPRKYDEYYNEFKTLTNLLSNDAGKEGRYMDIAETTTKQENVRETANTYIKDINTLLKNLTNEVAGKFDKIKGYTKKESAQIRIGYYVYNVYQNNISENPNDLSYSGGELRQALARLYFGYNNTAAHRTVDNAYREITYLLNKAASGAGIFDDTELNNGVLQTFEGAPDDDNFYDLSGDIESPF